MFTTRDFGLCHVSVTHARARYTVLKIKPRVPAHPHAHRRATPDPGRFSVQRSPATIDHSDTHSSRLHLYPATYQNAPHHHGLAFPCATAATVELLAIKSDI